MSATPTDDPTGPSAAGVPPPLPAAANADLDARIRAIVDERVAERLAEREGEGESDREGSSSATISDSQDRDHDRDLREDPSAGTPLSRDDRTRGEDDRNDPHAFEETRELTADERERPVAGPADDDEVLHDQRPQGQEDTLVLDDSASTGRSRAGTTETESESEDPFRDRSASEGVSTTETGQMDSAPVVTAERDRSDATYLGTTDPDGEPEPNTVGRRMEPREPVLDDHPVEAHDLSGMKTSAAAAFALVFGLSALICTLTILLSPVGVVFGLIAVILGFVGLSKSKRPLITGRGIAMSGLIMGLLGLLLGAAVLAGTATFLNNQDNIDRIEQRLEQLRDDFPTTVPDELNNN